jgi:para-nitrobenzyl esterase
MHKTTITMAAAFLAAVGLPLAAAAQESRQVQANNERPYSVDTTTIGTLLDDPEAAAILERLIPTVYDNDMFRTMGRPNTLRVAQQYEAAVLTEEKMQEIQAELDKLPSNG